MTSWYKIDNAGKVFQAVKTINSSVYRLSAIMTEPIDATLLQDALNAVIGRFPTLAVKVYKGFFWDFLEDNREKITVEQETTYPCHPIEPRKNNGYLFRVLYFQQRISVEICHSLTDGTGAVKFMKTLLRQYLILQGKPIVGVDGILLPDEMPSKCEMEDSFEKYYHPNTEHERFCKSTRRPVQIRGTPFNPKGISVIHGVISASRVNDYAKGLGTSLTVFLSALLIQAIYSERMKCGFYEEKITVALPIDLRQRFPSVTLRNFFAVLNLEMEFAGGAPLQEIVETISKQLKKQTEKEALQAKINQYTRLQRNLRTRIVPLSIKHPVIRYGFKRFGEKAKTITLSNLGNITLPTCMGHFVERMEVILYPTKNSPINCAICSVNDQMTITFARSITEAKIIKAFFSQLSSLTSLDLNIYSNNWGEIR